MSGNENIKRKEGYVYQQNVGDDRLFKNKYSDRYYKKFFFRHASIVTTILFILGLLSSVIIYITTGDIFRATAVIFLLVWLVVFLRYFLWAVYHYNVNYGISITDWEKIDDAKQRLKNGDRVLKSELREPQFNPYRSQTFGIPRGTVRGMLAFTLLFGAISILIASMGMDRVDLENSLIRDQFEFFKTAFLMMMAFYFGDKSLRFLQQRWKNPNPPTASTTGSTSQKSNVGGSNSHVDPQELDLNEVYNDKDSGEIITINESKLGTTLGGDEDQFLDEDIEFAEEEGLKKVKKSIGSNLTALKKGLNAHTFANLDASPEMLATADDPEEKTIDNIEDGHLSCDYPCTPIIDAGHGGFLEGLYTTGDKKKYAFTGKGQGSLEIFEGDINRKIAQKLIQKLKDNRLPYYDLNSEDPEDMPLWDRVREANKIYKKDASVYYLSIHSNASASGIEGGGGRAHGFEVFSSVGETPSDILSRIAGKEYKRHFNGEFRFRGVKEKNFRVLKSTICPAILVENLFFDNYKEAQFLLSDEGQEAIANCLLDVVRSIHFHYEGSLA